MIVLTDRLVLRQWTDADIPLFIQMNRDPAVMKYFPNTFTDEETMNMVHRINLHFDNKGYGLFAVEIKSTKEFIGFTGFSTPTFEHFFTPCIEIGWRYKKEAWGQGFATEAASACLQYGFDKLGFDKVVSFTSLVNKKSEKVMQQIGMKQVAEFDHPKIDTTSLLCRHVLYQVTKKAYTNHL